LGPAIHTKVKLRKGKPRSKFPARMTEYAIQALGYTGSLNPITAEVTNSQKNRGGAHRTEWRGVSPGSRGIVRAGRLTAGTPKAVAGRGSPALANWGNLTRGAKS